MIEKYVALSLMAVFYAAYFRKKLAQRRRGIVTDQIGRGSKPDKVLRVENLMKIATLAVVPIEIASILLYPGLTVIRSLRDCVALRWAGIAVAAAGVAFFISAMLTMADSWRAGIPDKDRTEFVQRGIYRISRNPAFVGFDLMYAGLLMAFPNILHLAFAVFPMVMLHLQILQEETFCSKVFGPEYDAYRRRVRRYL